MLVQEIPEIPLEIQFSAQESFMAASIAQCLTCTSQLQLRHIISSSSTGPLGLPFWQWDAQDEKSFHEKLYQCEQSRKTA